MGESHGKEMSKPTRLKGGDKFSVTYITKCKNKYVALSLPFSTMSLPCMYVQHEPTIK